MTDEELLKMILKKDMRAFDYIMASYNKLLWLVVSNILIKTGTPEDVEDCISDVYLKLLENPGLYDYNKGSFKSFLVKMAKNLAIDRYRKLTRNGAAEIHEQTVAHDEDDLLQLIIAKENREKVFEALDNLKETDREIIIRRYFFNEKVKIISEKMLLQTKDIENRLYQSKLRLRKFLECREG